MKRILLVVVEKHVRIHWIPVPKIKLNVDSIFNNVKQFSKMFESILNMDLMICSAEYLILVI